MVKEVKEHLTDKLIPFWENLRDEENGGYYGYLGYDLVLDKKAEKGCILNSRILWFFSNAYTLLKEESLRSSEEYPLHQIQTHLQPASSYREKVTLLSRNHR